MQAKQAINVLNLPNQNFRILYTRTSFRRKGLVKIIFKTFCFYLDF